MPQNDNQFINQFSSRQRFFEFESQLGGGPLDRVKLQLGHGLPRLG